MNGGVAATQATPQKLRMHIPACDGSLSIKQIIIYNIFRFGGFLWQQKKKLNQVQN